MNRTKIEWTNYTWNPITGCENNCRFCYARKIAKRFPKNFPRGFEPTFYPDRLKEPYQLKRPSLIFTVSMGDMFGSWVPDLWVTRVFRVIWDHAPGYGRPEHQFQILTKFPQNIPYFSAISCQNYKVPGNCWLGTSINYQGDVWRKDALLKWVRRKTGVFFVSFEPLLEPIDIDLTGLDWIIIGAQTNPLKLPEPEWVQSLIDQAREKNIPVFLKDNLSWSKKIQEFPRRGSATVVRLASNQLVEGSNPSPASTITMPVLLGGEERARGVPKGVWDRKQRFNSAYFDNPMNPLYHIMERVKNEY